MPPTYPSFDARNRVDYFISRATQDKECADEVALVLGEANCTFVVQDHDILPGDNFVLKMEHCLQAARNFVLVLTENYLSSPWCNEEWSAFWRNRVGGNEGRHLAVLRFSECKVPMLLDTCVRGDLFGILDSFERRRKIIDVSQVARISRSSMNSPARDNEKVTEIRKKLQLLDRLRDESGLEDIILQTKRDLIRAAVGLK